MDFLSRLEAMSRRKGIENNYQLAERSGVPYTTIDNFYRNGFENIKLTTLRKLAAFFECSLDDLIFGEEAGQTAAGPDATAFSERERGLVRKYRALSGRDQGVVDGLLDALTEKNG